MRDTAAGHSRIREIDLKRQIGENAGTIRQLGARIHETLPQRDKSPEGRREWQEACRRFNDTYDRLAFPGGYAGAAERIVAGDPLAVEAALSFLEIRPYFFRSGYMCTVFLRKLKRAPLTEAQAARLQQIRERLAAWRLIRDQRRQAEKS